MEHQKKTQERSPSVSSDSSGGLFNIGPYDTPNEEEIVAKQKKLEEKEARRHELNSVYHNCFFGQQTKKEKADHKIQKRRLKRKKGRLTRKANRKKFLDSMPKEERDAYLREQKKNAEESEIRVAEG
jgi:hypothetical protein